MPLITVKEIEEVAPIFRGKVGNSVCSWLLKVFNFNKLSDGNDSISQFRGAEFARAVQDVLAKIKVTVNGKSREDAVEELKRTLPEGPYITISNHLMGMVDGTILIDLFGHVRDDFKCMVNEVLTRFESLCPSLIAVNPNGDTIKTPSPQSILGIKQAMEHLRSGKTLGIFPAGAVSDLHPFKKRTEGTYNGIHYKEPRIHDREWQVSAIKLIRWAKVPVVPVRLIDGNSRFYYNLGLLSWKLRLLRLPSELFNKEGRTFRVSVGPVISPDTIKSCSSLDELGALLRASVYSLGE